MVLLFSLVCWTLSTAIWRRCPIPLLHNFSIYLFFASRGYDYLLIFNISYKAGTNPACRVLSVSHLSFNKLNTIQLHSLVSTISYQVYIITPTVSDTKTVCLSPSGWTYISFFFFFFCSMSRGGLATKTMWLKPWVRGVGAISFTIFGKKKVRDTWN